MMVAGTVAVAMSGGVDSSVAAALLKESGLRVFGVTMQLWCEQRHGGVRPRPTCCSIDDITDARAVCERLGIPFYVLNFESEFEAKVVDRFCDDYSRGLTPNPCVYCNRYIKFDSLLRKAESYGADYLATGHYAGISLNDGALKLLRAADRNCDQSYFLYMLGQAELSRVVFPLDKMRKAEVRRKARECGLPVADKPKSQDICFIPDGDVAGFLSRRAVAGVWTVRDENGKRLGTSDGSGFTVGQRCGLGLALGKRAYIIGIDAPGRTLIVGGDDRLLRDSMYVEDLMLVNDIDAGQPVDVTVKIRYKSPETRAVLRVEGRCAEVRFSEPQRAITPGQAAVFYVGDSVMGGGTICGG